MALITRISRLFSADLHAVLDRVEEPDIVLKQSIRDMQAAVAAADRQLRGLRARQEHIGASTAAAEGRLRETEEELAVCLDANNDDLARSVIQRKLRLERTLSELASQSERTGRALEEQERSIERRRHELETLRSKAEVYDNPPGDSVDSTAGISVTRDEVEVALLREKQRRARS